MGYKQSGIPSQMNTIAYLITRLCKSILTQNYFRFSRDIFLSPDQWQCNGHTSACSFTACLKQCFLSSCLQKPFVYLRFTDDIFIIWTHRKEALMRIQQGLNNFHRTNNCSLNKIMQNNYFPDTAGNLNNP